MLGGPAATAGVEPGDVITAIDGESVGTVEAFLSALRERQPGEQIEVEMVRGGEMAELQVTLTQRSA